MNIYPEQFEDVAKEIETLDKNFREHGISEEWKTKWNVTHNVGVWAVGRKTAETLFALVRKHKPKIILELGTSVGYSTMWLALAAKEYGGRVITVEDETYKITSAKENLRRAGVLDNVECIEKDIFETLKSWKESIDFLFIDAEKRSYYSFVKQLEPFMHSGTVIAADDVLSQQEQTKEFSDYLIKSNLYTAEIRAIDRGLMVGIKK